MSDSRQFSLRLIGHSYEGEVIQQRARDGYINATAMCKAAGKHFKRHIPDGRSSRPKNRTPARAGFNFWAISDGAEGLRSLGPVKCARNRQDGASPPSSTRTSPAVHCRY
jgi:KilA domain-containing protein